MKITFYSFLFILFASCKKNYQCFCNTSFTYQTTSGGYNTVIYPNEKKPYTTKMTLKQAQSACDHQEPAIKNSFTAALTNNGSYQLNPGEKVEVDCILNN